MFNYSLLIILNAVAVMIEFTYDAGVFTRNHILPVLIYLYIVCVMCYEYTAPRVTKAIQYAIAYDYNTLRNRIGGYFVYA